MSKRWIPILFAAMLSVAMACHRHARPSRDVDSSQDALESAIGQSDSLLVVLRGKVRPEQIEGAFQAYGLKRHRHVDKESNTWVFTYDLDSIDQDEFIRLLTDGQFSRSAIVK